MKSLKPRLLTAFFGILLLLGIVYLSSLWLPTVGIAAGLASMLMTVEYLKANNLLKRASISIPCMTFSMMMSLLANAHLEYLLVTALLIVLFSVMIFKHKQITYSELAYSVTGTLLISFGMSALTKICTDSSLVLFMFVTIFAIPWMSDAGGFFVGASLGRHKLCPSISPKKTIEGAVGGIIFAVLTSVLIGLIFNIFVFKDFSANFFALGLLGIIDAPLSIIGDLSFSLIKRCYNIKDYGSIFPGHGGILDRFDSIIFTAPIIVIINQFIPIITTVQV